MRRLLTLLVLLLLALLLLGPAARAQDLRVVSSSPAPGDSSVALEGTVTFTFSAPLDTARRFEDAEWPVAFAAISPRDSIQVDSVRYSDDLTQIHFDVTHTDSTDFVWMLSEAFVQDTVSITGYRRAWLEPPYLLRYTTASTTGRYSVSGSGVLCIATKRASGVGSGFIAALLRSQPEVDASQNIVWIDSLWTDVAAAAVTVGGRCDGDFIIADVRPGTYWPVAIHDADYAVAYDYLPDGSPDSIVVIDSSLSGIDLIVRGSAVEDEAGPATATLHPNRPNPFRTTTRLPFTLDRPGRVRLVVYDLLGRRLATLADGFHPAGEHAVVWQAADVPPGVYLVRLEGDGFLLTRPVVRVR